MLDYRKYPIPRIRHHTSPQLYLPVAQHRTIPEWYPPLIDQAPWESWFANGRPADVLDIGCGRGGFLLQHALHRPGQNVLGIEVRHTLVNWINNVIAGEEIPNARAAWYSVVNGLGFIPDASIDHAFYLFPDPWPKKRHYKRRAFSPEFLAEVWRVLRPGGRLYLATDRPDVDEFQRHVLGSMPGVVIRDVVVESDWPFPFVTDQQDFCHRKDIPYVRYMASLDPTS
ncbi:MAG: methyltransferase domain-containing protein ['Candidatus Kapabacteria' thiocyanatum]|uniref:tRNA (guanine(46)-N(7))-methyltransferase n=1 Tax=Candidatus Kapaibacterium thiocyanatum TaxID=1895771 RepID=A0A1M3KV06_9BACT|nr:methyltransferase domain-containing protein ['Candidatus Kapabacteria' thiocyanatum]OJX56210.1 MAG: hypothetical protein BGO89_12770 ['Candidatus Kapabacteria' thiocyanatum]